VQAYEAYPGALKLFSDEFTARTAVQLDAGAVPQALQTIVGTLCALKSTTDFQTQPVNLCLALFHSQHIIQEVDIPPFWRQWIGGRRS
jgi:hypothetical protein